MAALSVAATTSNMNQLSQTAEPDTSWQQFRSAELALQRQRTRQGALFFSIFLLALGCSLFIGEVRLDIFLEGFSGLTNYVGETLPPISISTFAVDIAAWFWGIKRWLGLLLDTILIAILGTFLGGILAAIACFPASQTLRKGLLSYQLTRRLMEVARAVPELVYALIFVFAFGLGPLPGVLAIAVHSFGSLGKLFSEVNENIDPLPLEGVRAAGGNWLQEIRFGVLPQVMPNFLSYTLLRFEINVRAASIIGFVGAGGIGQELMFVIRQFVYTDISAIVLLLIITVACIDISCEKIRHHYIDIGVQA